MTDFKTTSAELDKVQDELTEIEATVRDYRKDDQEQAKAMQRLYTAFANGLEAVKEDNMGRVLAIVDMIRENTFGHRGIVNEAVKAFISQSKGEFSYRDICNTLHLTNKTDKNNASKALSREIEKGYLIRTGKRNDIFRRPETEMVLMDWKKADISGIDIKFPLGEEELVKIFQKNIIVIAGGRNQGKTAYCLDFTRLNMNQHDVYYFVNDMGEEEFRYRIELFDDLKQGDWNFNPFALERNWEDQIRPDDINIVDFLKVTEDFSLVGHAIEKIHRQLDKGVCLIALQKPYGRDIGVGGEFTLDVARLYLSLDFDRIKVVKAKNWKGHDNPCDKIREFKLVNGSKFIPQGDWASQEAYDQLKPRWERR